MRNTYLVRIVCEAIRPYEFQIIFKLPLRLVVLLFDLLEHRLEVHRILDDCTVRRVERSTRCH